MRRQWALDKLTSVTTLGFTSANKPAIFLVWKSRRSSENSPNNNFHFNLNFPWLYSKTETKVSQFQTDLSKKYSGLFILWVFCMNISMTNIMVFRIL